MMNKITFTSIEKYEGTEFCYITELLSWMIIIGHDTDKV
jgi:hypothetical protein